MQSCLEKWHHSIVRKITILRGVLRPLYSEKNAFCSHRVCLRAYSYRLSGTSSPPESTGGYFSTLRSLKSLEKHSVSRLSYLFAHLHLLSSGSFSSDLLSSNLSLLSASALLSFSSVHIVGSLFSKFPSIIVVKLWHAPRCLFGFSFDRFEQT